MIQNTVRFGVSLFVWVLAYGLFFIPDTEAALLYFDPASVDIYRGDTITLGLRLDTDEGECINTVDALIHYDESISAIDISRGDSILNIWLEDPVINESDRTIRFAGGIPGGYCGRISGDPSLTNVILEIVFRSPGFAVGGGGVVDARVWVDEGSQVLLHDGFGTNAPLRLQSSSIKLLTTAGNIPQDSWRAEVLDDDQLPSDFVITLAQEENAFNGQYFITFNSIDKQAGIDHYEVMEEPFSEFQAFKWGGADVPWIRTESPFVLKDQTLNSTIRVKAIDKAGNERIVTFVPDTALRSMSRDMLIAVSVGGGFVTLVIVLVVYALVSRRQRLTNQLNKISNEV